MITTLLPTTALIDLSQIRFDAVKFAELSLSLLTNFVLALLIFWIGRWVIQRIVAIADMVMARTQLDATVASFLSNLLYGVLFVVVVLAALSKLGVNTTSFVAVLGGATVAIGISLKDQLSNFAAGVMIIIFRPFSRGDSVEISGKTGVVQGITLINTRLVTVNNHEIIIPNGQITTNVITNFSMRQTRRVEVVVTVGYHADIKAAKTAMLNAATQNPKVLSQPPASVQVTKLGDSSLELTLHVWVNSGDWYAVQCDLLEHIKYGFDSARIEMPKTTPSVSAEDLEKTLDKKLSVIKKSDDFI